MRDSSPETELPTPRRLIMAAAEEFNERGFANTDTNRIARRAGFAPQTFYRWFKDKTEIFLEVYRDLIAAQFEGARRLIARGASDEDLIHSAVDHHRRFAVFRRSLRTLALENPGVRQARAESRLGQIKDIHAWLGNPCVDEAGLAIFLLEHERLCDAIADGEFADLGIADAVATARLRELYAALRTRLGDAGPAAGTENEP